MESIVSSLKKSFATLNEEERIHTLLEIVEQHNRNLRNDKFLKLLAPPRQNTRLSLTMPYTGTCICGHNSTRHWFINWDYKECKSCDCECFRE